MTFQEILAEVKTLSREEQSQLINVLQDDMEETEALAVFKKGGVYEITTPIFEGSLQPLIDTLK